MGDKEKSWELRDGRCRRRQRRQQNVLLSILTQKCTRAKHKVASHLGRPMLGQAVETRRSGRGIAAGTEGRESGRSFSYKIK